MPSVLYTLTLLMLMMMMISVIIAFNVVIAIITANEGNAGPHSPQQKFHHGNK